MQIRRKTLRTVVAVVGLTLLASFPAHGVTLFKFKGTVRDAIGRALGGATVTDGSKSTTTASNGTYTLAEDSTGRFTLRSYRSDTATTTKTVDVTVPLDQTVDFTLYYKITGLLTQSALSTANGSASTVLTVTSSAPNPGAPGQTGGKSCVYITDGRTSQTSLATYVSTNPTTGASTWTYLLELAQGTAQGNYQLSLAAKDCSSGAVLSSTPAPAVSYVVDNTAPSFDIASLAPALDGNTINTSQPLLVKVADTGGAGFQGSSLKFTLTNQTTGATSTFTGATVSYTSSTGWAKSPAATLVQGGLYSATVEGTDLAGNARQLTWNFRHMSLTAVGAKALIKGTTGKAAGNNKWSFLPELTVRAFQVTSSASKHSGWGPVGQRVPLSTARVEYDIGALHLTSTTKPYAAGANVLAYKQFQKLEREGLNTKTLDGQGVLLQPITVTLPVGAKNAVLKMDPVISTPYIAAKSCPSPDVGQAGCSPDPLRFFIPAGFANQIAVSQDGASFPAALKENPASLAVHVGGLEPHWQPVNLDQGILSINYDDELIGFLEGAHYAGTMWPQTPAQFVQACAMGYACTASAAAASDDDELRHECVLPDGYDHNEGEDCIQLLTMIPAPAPSHTGTNRLGTYMLSQIGFADNYDREGAGSPLVAYEELGLAWEDSNAAWTFTGVAWRSNVYDAYYCDGDENRTDIYAPIHHHWTWANKSASNVGTGFAYDGFWMPDYRQYRYTKDVAPGIDNNCWGRYVPGSTAWHNRLPLARTRYVYMDADWTTNQTQLEGWVMISWGHVWTTYEYDWEIGAHVFGCGFEGCGPSIGFTFNPHNEQHSYLWSYAVHYCVGYSNC